MNEEALLFPPTAGSVRTSEAIALDDALARYVATSGCRHYVVEAYHAWKATEHAVATGHVHLVQDDGWDFEEVDDEDDGWEE